MSLQSIIEQQIDKIEKAATADLSNEFRGIDGQIYRRIRQKSELSSRDNAEEIEHEYISIKVKKMEHDGVPVIVVKFADCHKLVKCFLKVILQEAQSWK